MSTRGTIFQYWCGHHRDLRPISMVIPFINVHFLRWGCVLDCCRTDFGGSWSHNFLFPVGIAPPMNTIVFCEDTERCERIIQLFSNSVLTYLEF